MCASLELYNFWSGGSWKTSAAAGYHLPHYPQRRKLNAFNAVFSNRRGYNPFQGSTITSSTASSRLQVITNLQCTCSVLLKYLYLIAISSDAK